MTGKNAIVKCTACGAVWLSRAQSPRCASRGCRSTAIQRLAVAEVEEAVDHLLDCLNEYDENIYYALVKINDDRYQNLPEDFDLSEFLAKAIDADEEHEEDDEKSPRDKAKAAIREERASLRAILALIPDEPKNEDAREELEAEIAVLDRRYYALLRDDAELIIVDEEE